MVNEKEFDVDTLAGIKHVTIKTSDLGDVINIKVDMGEGSFKTSDIPMATDKEKFIEERVHILDRDFHNDIYAYGCISYYSICR